MTWGEIQIESLKKMFLNNEDLDISDIAMEYKDDKKYKTYLFAMPQACNEAINYIISRLGSSAKLEKLEKTNLNAIYNLSSLYPDYRKLKKLYFNNNIIWNFVDKNNIYIESWHDGEILVSYEVLPAVISSTTEKDHKIELDEKYSRLIPLYIAGELYKDDDLAMATMYMNEFMTMIDSFAANDYEVVNPTISTIYSIN